MDIQTKGLTPDDPRFKRLVAFLDLNFIDWSLLPVLQQTPCTTQLPPTYAVNRVEVIDEAGRSYVNWNKKNCVEVQLQDESRTMKVFISRR